MSGSVARLGRALLAPLPPEERTPRYLWLDGLRGFAAVAVLFWHYQHFFLIPGPILTNGVAAREPLHGLFAPFFDHGYDAVPLFWMLSGFVFAAVYAGRAVATRSFVGNRVARLYPLHLLTLVAVALLQWALARQIGTTLIYGNNDAAHFAAQLVFASAWIGGDAGQSFNGPIWSVSVEVLVYALFWAVHRRLFARGVVWPALLAGGAAAAMLVHPHQVIFCAEMFFAGCALHGLHRLLGSRPRATAALAAVAGLAGLALWREASRAQVAALPLAFGALILALAALDRSGLPKPRRLLALIGDSTYGLYLWHIPLQLALFLALGTAIPAMLADRTWFLLAFLGGAIGLARASFLLFERPMRERIRRLAGDIPARPAIAAP